LEHVAERPVAELAAKALMDVNRRCAAVELVLDNVEDVQQWLAVFIEVGVKEKDVLPEPTAFQGAARAARVPTQGCDSETARCAPWGKARR
jgi:hypothetical protein